MLDKPRACRQTWNSAPSGTQDGIKAVFTAREFYRSGDLDNRLGSYRGEIASQTEA